MFEVGLSACPDYEYETVRAALEKAIGDVDGLDFVKAGMKIAIKVNLVSYMAPEKAATTHPTAVKALCDMLTERGASVVIGDSPGGLYNAAYVGKVYRATGMRDLVREGVSLNEDYSQKEADFPDAVQAKKFVYTGYLDDADAIIDFCKLKTHGMMGMSCAAKNLFGTIPGTYKPEYHFRYQSYEAFADMIVDLNEYFKPTLSVCDGVIGMEGNGPTAGTPRAIGCLFASKSAHKLDLVAASVIGLTKDDVPTLMAAYKRGMIPGDASEVSVSSDPMAFFIPDYEKVASLHSLGFKGASNNVLGHIFGSFVGVVLASKPKLKKSLCVGCNVCGGVCPAKAIVMKNGKAHIDRKACIKCFCCQEFCPKGAMRVHRTFIAKLINH